MMKLTKKEMYDAILTLLAGGELESSEMVETIKTMVKHEIDLLNKKRSSSGVSTAELKRREAIDKQVLEDFATLDGQAVTVSEFMELFGEHYKDGNGKAFSNSKFTSIFTRLGTGNTKVEGKGLLKNTKDKKKSLYSLA